ncbi:MarR family winged helix-turn-helix transcriptional regulator [Luteococcus sp. Sow4_B9]|uniref:MarR family winged helix-turn-helix transcriptional regulator n=1 Tax=Luteococcus sp. Sow4_B9 TaxID=3438792 RepID=UPI003F9D65BE
MDERGRRVVRESVPTWTPSPVLTSLNELAHVMGLAWPAVARRADLTDSELHALRELAQRDVGPAELARTLGVTRAAATGIVDRLVAKGHVERHAHPTDRRRTVLDLTESGRGEVAGLLAPMLTALAESDAKLTEQEKVLVSRFLDEVIEAVRTVL